MSARVEQWLHCSAEFRNNYDCSLALMQRLKSTEAHTDVEYVDVGVQDEDTQLSHTALKYKINLVCTTTVEYIKVNIHLFTTRQDAQLTHAHTVRTWSGHAASRFHDAKHIWIVPEWDY